MTSLYFATSNDYKFTEFERHFADHSINLLRLSNDVQEIQTVDFEPIVRHKVLAAYAAVSRPVLVDVSGMNLNVLKGLPGGLNKQFWEALKETVCDIADKLGDQSAQIVSYLGLCDGENIHQYGFSKPGSIAPSIAPTGDFHLDRVFIPVGETKRLADMTEAERDIHGYRKPAVQGLIDQLRGTRFGMGLGIR